MPRGDYEEFIKNESYTESLKRWCVELQRVDMIWYDLIVNDHGPVPLKDHIKEMFKDLNNHVKENIEKRFIYFIASRDKVRFSVSKNPKYSLSGKKLYIYLEIGKDRIQKRITIKSEDIVIGGVVNPKVGVTSKFITFTDTNGDMHSTSVHDFLLHGGFNLGIDTCVQYVGKTKNPEKRPINGIHAGLNEVIYKLPTEQYDIFIYYNIFKVMTSGGDKKSGINFIVPNSMTDEVNVEKEGDILEKCLILYFLSENQFKNRENEISELKNNLTKLANKNKINKVSIGYEVDDESDYYKFGSSLIKPKFNHSFCFSIEDNELTGTLINNIYE